jgi:hypothetical protein
MNNVKGLAFAFYEDEVVLRQLEGIKAHPFTTLT